jgi:alkylation response protein AidB-like acyl-CoA dehydrogenase
MKPREMELTPEQSHWQAGVREFVRSEVMPRADECDQCERISPETIAAVARQGYLGAVVPRKFGGGEVDMISCGLLHEEIGKGCSSLRSLLTVQGMVAEALTRWGSEDQKRTWLPRLASGEAIGAFALTEPNVGSDAKHVEATASASGSGFVLDGHKKWITFAQIADVFVVVAQCEGSPTAFLVERDAPGLSLVPMHGLLGMRASMLAEIDLGGCWVPKANLLGRVGSGFAHVAAVALDHGRYTVAWGCVGIAQLCLDASVDYAARRSQFGQRLNEHQLIQRLIANMIVSVQAARLLCLRAGCSKDAGRPGAVMQTTMAKYFASGVAVRAASDAVQIHGANGCARGYPVERCLRDAKIMEIIEGSNEMQQLMIARHGYGV